MMVEAAGVDWGSYTPDIGKAILVTVEITAVSFVGAVLLGFVVAVMRISRTPLRFPAIVYTELFKNIPAIVPIFVIYYGLPSAGIVLSTFVAGCTALILFYASYLAEIFRGGLLAVHSDQNEASTALGFSPRGRLWYVILPQAVRYALPGTGTMLIDLLKATSLLVLISAGDLLSQATKITSATFQPLQVYLVFGAIYFVLCWPLSQSVLLLERLVRRGVAISPRRRRMQKRLTQRIQEYGSVAASGVAK